MLGTVRAEKRERETEYRTRKTTVKDHLACKQERRAQSLKMIRQKILGKINQ